MNKLCINIIRLGVNKMNGNKFKGNKQKKGSRGRKDVYADFNPDTDHYGKILGLEGGKHASVSLLPNGTTIRAMLRGIHHKKVWFKKDDLVIIRGDSNFAEVWGKVNDNESNQIRRDFDKLEGKNNSSMVIFNESDDSDDEQQTTAKPGMKSQTLQLNSLTQSINKQTIEDTISSNSIQYPPVRSTYSTLSTQYNLNKKPAVGEDEPFNIDDI